MGGTASVAAAHEGPVSDTSSGAAPQDKVSGWARNYYIVAKVSWCRKRNDNVGGGDGATRCPFPFLLSSLNGTDKSALH